MSAIPAIEAQALVSDSRWPTYRDYLLERRRVLQHRLEREVPLDHPAMCRIAGEIRGLNYALGIPDELKVSDPRSET